MEQGLFSVGLNTYFTVSTLNSKMKQGDSLGVAALKSASGYAFRKVAPHASYGLMAAELGVSLGAAGFQVYQNKSNWLRANLKPGPRFRYTDTEGAHTMRQAAVQAIQGSKLNARSALGGEARLLATREAYNTFY